MPKLSIVVPFHWMSNWQFYLTRCLESIEKQTFTDYEVILTKAGSMPVNTNRAIQTAQGELIKVLYMDDYLSDEHILQSIVDGFVGTNWMIVGSNNNQHPYWTPNIETGNNKLGSPSALVMRNDNPLLFDENMSWLLDCDYYKRMYQRYGLPEIIQGDLITIGQHVGQMTHILTDEDKAKEFEYITKKYE